MATTERNNGENKGLIVPSQEDNFDELFSQLLCEEPEITPEDETTAALTEMRLDQTAHLTKPVLQLALCGDIETIAEIVLPHLVSCSWCCNTLEEALRLSGAGPEHRAFAILDDARNWMRWDSAGETAAEAACRTLTDQGIGYVYGRAGKTYRRLPDGSEEELIDEPKASGS